MIARIGLGVLLGATAGCHAVRPLWEPEEFLARSKPPVIYVVQRDRPVSLTVTNPSLSGDTLRGTDQRGRPVAVPWDDVLDVYARRLHTARTVFAVSSMALASAITVYAFVQKASGTFFITCETPVSAYEHDRDVECGR